MKTLKAMAMIVLGVVLLVVGLIKIMKSDDLSDGPDKKPEVTNTNAAPKAQSGSANSPAGDRLVQVRVGSAKFAE